LIWCSHLSGGLVPGDDAGDDEFALGEGQGVLGALGDQGEVPEVAGSALGVGGDDEQPASVSRDHRRHELVHPASALGVLQKLQISSFNVLTALLVGFHKIFNSFFY